MYNDGKPQSEACNAVRQLSLMWQEIEPYFTEYPAQLRVAKLLFERGFQVREDCKVVSGNIEIPHTQIAKEIGVDRRVVDSTLKTILQDTKLKKIYANLWQVCSLQEVAREFDLGVIIFEPKDAHETGLIAKVTQMVSARGLSIKQALAEDTDGTNPPCLILILEGDIPADLITDIRSLPGTKRITIY
jgi:predicted regulator of amino acid metabolism with ACT domain